MSSRSSRRIRLYERQQQWELELIPEKDEEEDDFARSLDCIRRGVVNTVSAIFKATGLQLETLAQLRIRPNPNVWDVLGARDRVLTPRSHQLMYGKPVELAAMTAGGDVSSEPAMRITGLTTTTVTAEDSSLIFVFMPMSSFTTLPETPYNVTDITSRVFVPATQEQEESLTLSNSRVGRQSSGSMTRSRNQTQESEEEERTKEGGKKKMTDTMLIEMEQGLIEEKEQMEEKQIKLDVIEKEQKEKEEELKENFQKVAQEREDLQVKQEELQVKSEQIVERQQALDTVEQQQKEKDEEQTKREEKIAEEEKVLEEKSEQMDERKIQLDAVEEQQQAKHKEQEEKEEKLKEEQEHLNEREKQLDDVEQQQKEKHEEQLERERKLDEDEKILRESEEKVREQEEEVHQREEKVLKEEEAVKEREAKAEQEEKRLEEWDQKMKEKEEVLNDRETKLDELQTKLAEEEAIQQERKASLDELEETLKEREAKAEEKGKELEEKEKLLAEKEEEQTKKQEELQAQEQQQNEREQSLNEYEERLKNMQTRLEEEEELLKGRECVLVELEEKQKERELRVIEEEEKLNERAQVLDETEEKHREWEMKSNEEQEIMSERQKALEELEAMLKDWEKRCEEEEERRKIEEERIKAAEEVVREREKAVEEEEEKQTEIRKSLEEEEERLTASKKSLEEEEEKLKEKQTKFEEEEEQLTQREQKVKEEEETLTQREEKIKEEEETLTQREEKIKEEKETLTQREEKIKEEEETLTQREEKIKEEKETLTQREEKIKEEEEALTQKEEKIKKEEEDVVQREQKITQDEEKLWKKCSSNSRFKIRPVEGAASTVGKSAKPRSRSSPSPRAIRAVSPGSGSDAASIASMLTEDEVLMISSYKGDKTTIVETYDIKFLREEIFDTAKESVSVHGSISPGKGYRKSHESESFVLSADEMGRISRSSQSSATSLSRSPVSHLNAERKSSPSRDRSKARSVSRDSDRSQSSNATETTDISVELDRAVSPQHGPIRAVSFSEDSKREGPARDNDEGRHKESDRSHSKSPPPISERQRSVSPTIIYSFESQSAELLHSSKASIDKRKSPLFDSSQQQAITESTTEAITSEDYVSDLCDYLTCQTEKASNIAEDATVPPVDAELYQADTICTPNHADRSAIISPTVRLLETLEEQEERENSSDSGSSKAGESEMEGEARTKKAEKVRHGARKGRSRRDDGYSLERTDITSSSEESSEAARPTADISIDCISPEIAKILPKLTVAAAAAQGSVSPSGEATGKTSPKISSATEGASVQKPDKVHEQSISPTLSATTRFPVGSPGSEHPEETAEMRKLNTEQEEAIDLAHIDAHPSLSLDKWSVASSDSEEEVAAHETTLPHAAENLEHQATPDSVTLPLRQMTSTTTPPSLAEGAEERLLEEEPHKSPDRIPSSPPESRESPLPSDRQDILSPEASASKRSATSSPLSPLSLAHEAADETLLISSSGEFKVQTKLSLPVSSSLEEQVASQQRVKKEVEEAATSSAVPRESQVLPRARTSSPGAEAKKDVQSPSVESPSTAPTPAPTHDTAAAKSPPQAKQKSQPPSPASLKPPSLKSRSPSRSPSSSHSRSPARTASTAPTHGKVRAQTPTQAQTPRSHQSPAVSSPVPESLKSTPRTPPTPLSRPSSRSPSMSVSRPPLKSPCLSFSRSTSVSISRSPSRSPCLPRGQSKSPSSTSPSRTLSPFLSTVAQLLEKSQGPSLGTVESISPHPSPPKESPSVSPARYSPHTHTHTHSKSPSPRTWTQLQRGGSGSSSPAIVNARPMYSALVVPITRTTSAPHSRSQSTSPVRKLSSPASPNAMSPYAFLTQQLLSKQPSQRKVKSPPEKSPVEDPATSKSPHSSPLRSKSPKSPQVTSKSPKISRTVSPSSVISKSPYPSPVITKSPYPSPVITKSPPPAIKVMLPVEAPLSVFGDQLPLHSALSSLQSSPASKLSVRPPSKSAETSPKSTQLSPRPLESPEERARLPSPGPTAAATMTQSPPAQPTPHSKLQSLVAHFQQQVDAANLQQVQVRHGSASSLSVQQEWPSNEMPPFLVLSPELQKESPQPARPASARPDKVSAKTSPPLPPRASTAPGLANGLSGIDSNRMSHISPDFHVQPKTPAKEYTAKALESSTKALSPIPSSRPQENATRGKATSPTHSATSLRRTPVPCPSGSNVSLASQRSATRGRSPSPGSLADMLQAQRRKAASPRPATRGRSTPQGTTTPIRTGSLDQTISDVPAPLSAPTPPSPASLSPVSSPVISRQPTGDVSPTSDVSSSDRMSSRQRRSVSHSVSPSRCLVGAVLKTNGAAGLKSMLARQRKASKDKEGVKLKATKADQSVQPRQEGQARPEPDPATSTFPIERVTTSVCEKRVEREGKPSSSIVTVTQKKVRYTKEPIRDDQPPASGHPSPPMISSVPLPTTATVHQPTAIFPGKRTGGGRKDMPTVSGQLRVTSAPASNTKGKPDNSVKRDLHHQPERTSHDREASSHHTRERPHESRRPKSETSRHDSSPKPPSPLPRHWMLGMMESEAQDAEVVLKKHPSKSRSPKPSRNGEKKRKTPSPNTFPECKSPIAGKTLSTFQLPHDELKQDVVFSKPAEPQFYSVSSGQENSHHKPLPVPGKDFKIGQMKERELLLRRRMQSKKHAAQRDPPTKLRAFRAGDSEESDFSDFFKEYQTECEKKGISTDKSFSPQASQRSIPQYLGTDSPKREKTLSPKTRGAPTSTSPPVKRRALSGYEDMDPENWAEADRPSNTCNSSPVRRARGHELIKFQAYPLRPPRTSPRVLRDRNDLPLALSQQLQTYRHQQGVVGDSVEMMQVFEPRRVDEPGTTEEPFPEQTFSRVKTRRKQGRRVSWNDNQSSSGTEGTSQNQNAASPSGDSILEEDREIVEFNRNLHDNDDFSINEVRRNNVEHTPLDNFSDNKNTRGASPSYSQGDAAHQKEKQTVQSPHPHKRRGVITGRGSTDVKEIRQQQHYFEKEDKKVSHTLTDSSRFRTALGATGEKIGTNLPQALQFSREQTQTTVYRPRENDDTSFAKEELMRRKEFTSKNQDGVTSLSQSQTLRKQYTMQSPRKRAVLTEERQHTKEYIFKKNPRTARFPEQTGHIEGPPQGPAQPSRHNASLPNKDRRIAIAPEPQHGARPNAKVSDTKTELTPHQKLSRDRSNSSTTSGYRLSLSEELRNAGFSPQQLTRESPADVHSDDGDSVDMMDYGSVDGGIDESVDPYPYPYAFSRSHIYDLNESANSSALADCDDKQSPGQNAREWDCAFFTPEVDVEPTGAVGGVVDVRLAPHEVIDDRLNFQSPVSEAEVWEGSSYSKAKTLAPGSDNHDYNGNTLYFSIYGDNAKTKADNVEGCSPPAYKPAVRRRRRRYEQSDNRNNSGDDHSKFTAGQKLLRQTEQTYTPYENAVETSACGGGDHQTEAAGGKVSGEEAEGQEKALDCTTYPRTQICTSRRRKSFGSSYISRLMAKRGYCETDSQDSSDNCAHRYSYHVSDEECIHARCCQNQIGQCASNVSQECGCIDKRPYCEECNCDEEQVELCPCSGQAEYCHQSYEDRDCEAHKLDNCCEACDCAVELTAALNVRDERHIPRAVTHLWQNSANTTYNYHHPDCAGLASPCDGEEGSNNYKTGEVAGGSPQDSIPSAYSDECQCADACSSSGRGDGDVHTDARKEEGDFNVSKCYSERHRRLGSHRLRHSESGTEVPEMRHGEENDEKFRGDSVSHRSHPHVHHRQDRDTKLSARSSTSLIHPTPSVTNDIPRSSGRDAHFTVTESMVQAYGYNPLTESPFTARGYPELPMDTSTLDHISVPFVKRKALVFLRTEKEEFVEVGRGTYGCVYLAQATTRRGTTKVVVKDFFTDSTSWDLIVHEARMLCYLQDTGVIPHFYGLLKRRSLGDDFSLIQQYFAQGRTLHTVLVNKEKLEPEVWQDIAWQLARGLLLIHERHVLLNDLKGDNVLIDLRRDRKVIKYIDLGMATYRKGLNFHLPEDQMTKFNFLSPEVRAGAYTSPMSDVYSLGYLLDQINRLAHLHVLQDTSARCLDELPADRPHLADVVDALQPDRDLLATACYTE